jgi:hypothetical protein
MYNQPLTDAKIQFLDKDEMFPSPQASLVLKADAKGLFNIVVKNRWGSKGVIQSPKGDEVDWDIAYSDYQDYMSEYWSQPYFSDEQVQAAMSFHEWLKKYFNSPTKKTNE